MLVILHVQRIANIITYHRILLYIQLSIQLKFALRINAFIRTTVVTAFIYGTHVG